MLVSSIVLYVCQFDCDGSGFFYDIAHPSGGGVSPHVRTRLGGGAVSGGADSCADAAYAAGGGGGLACAGAGAPTHAGHHNQAAIHPNKPQTSIPANLFVSVLASAERRWCPGPASCA
jgi:hypothetical protein